ncbi:15240_t:CDS:2, partial [Dentiscutata erythropus]
ALRANEENNERRDVKDLSRDVSLLSKPPTSSVTQDKESRSHKKKLEAENIVQDVFDFTIDGSKKKQLESTSHMMEISLMGCKENNYQEKIEPQGVIKFRRLNNSIGEIMIKEKVGPGRFMNDQKGFNIDSEEKISDDQTDALKVVSAE